MKEALDFDDVLMVPKVSEVVTRKQVDLMVDYVFPNGMRYNGIPILAANMKGVGSLKMASKLHELHLGIAIDKHEDQKEAQSAVNTYGGIFKGLTGNPAVDGGYAGIFYTAGIVPDLYSEFSNLAPNATVCLDVANGHSTTFLSYVEKVRKEFPNFCIMAGNVVTPEGVRNLATVGADIVKLGLGSGSVCTTRLKTGFGLPQFSAVVACRDAAAHWGVRICSDGGCKSPGDIAKAFGAGAHFVMIGGMLANARESELSTFEGSSSENAGYKTSEGKKVRITEQHDLSAIVADILGGLRSACSYAGAKSLEAFIGNQEFIKVNRQYNRMFE